MRLLLVSAFLVMSPTASFAQSSTFCSGPLCAKGDPFVDDLNAPPKISIAPAFPGSPTPQLIGFCEEVLDSVVPRPAEPSPDEQKQACRATLFETWTEYVTFPGASFRNRELPPAQSCNRQFESPDANTADCLTFIGDPLGTITQELHRYEVVASSVPVFDVWNPDPFDISVSPVFPGIPTPEVLEFCQAAMDVFAPPPDSNVPPDTYAPPPAGSPPVDPADRAKYASYIAQAGSLVPEHCAIKCAKQGEAEENACRTSYYNEVADYAIIPGTHLLNWRRPTVEDCDREYPTREPQRKVYRRACRDFVTYPISDFQMNLLMCDSEAFATRYECFMDNRRVPGFDAQGNRLEPGETDDECY